MNIQRFCFPQLIGNTHWINTYLISNKAMDEFTCFIDFLFAAVVLFDYLAGRKLYTTQQFETSESFFRHFNINERKL
jgi:hypothetical protein